MLLNLFELSLLTAVCTWLITKYITDAEISGPFDLFEKARSFLGVKKVEIPTPNGSPVFAYQSNGRFFAELISCPYCTGPYAGAFVVALFYLVGLVPLTWSLIVLWLSGWGFATAFVRVTDG